MAAGLCWGMIFSVPVLLPSYSPLALSAGRYLAFGLIVLLPAWLDRRRLAALGAADWKKALELALVGNLLYYCGIAFAAQHAGAPITAAIIGTLPVVIAISGNLVDKQVRWRRLALPLLLIGGGLALIHGREFGRAAVDTGGGDYLLGIAGALFALFCWTWYPLRNAAWIARRPQLSMTAWATAQGLATLPLALAAFVALAWLPDHDWPLGADPLRFVALMAALGLIASWLGTLFWNVASRALPATLSGQLIVFETLFGLAFAYALRSEWPDTASAVGIALLVAGVVVGVRACRPETP
ncbi:DMT family transporter [Azospira restricta]|uniref:DMT family transporter n=2 Tax=Azospira restricta TaxID=404405 RepID=A0A974SSF3_9RHOO|nr:DMT family transporter [Azospira restricta]